MFGIGVRRSATATRMLHAHPADVVVYTTAAHLQDARLDAALSAALPENTVHEIRGASELRADMRAPSAEFILSLLINPSALDPLADAVLDARRAGRSTTLIVAINGRQLAELGQWLDRRANDGKLGGMRLMLGDTPEAVLAELPHRLGAGADNNVIRMPISAEVDNSAFRNFFTFSPQLVSTVERIRAFAQNGVHRTYLLGGPGSGKTSLAYYYFLSRKRGRFVSVNLAAENTGDKAAVKSLLCGHVSGAFPGAGARTGAFTHARDGVCFIDESHGITGPVMEVLMEAFDSGQYLPFGASAKQPLDCAIVFATNRSWQQLQSSVNIDEFTRLGASTVVVPELHTREEDMIAVVATTLARLSARCTTWEPVQGISESGWALLRQSRWHGNIRALVRVLEAAFVDCAAMGAGALLQSEQIAHGIELWEPSSHHSHTLYATG
ncbi:hypothetical protein E4T66_08830 [Sinimarinibacterium sp. CAU 1509]|uniref:sigma 54-interacting transcriptional regulator n=1 Tax=Sinimarinibacterium sp. CAU 1509 TaxID=2562283 RepID=UPI0010AD0108|nr:sigma 54-interacting transcriptional regulator [Sinimarinibacterium sp. CAU 1509]TJY62310.1 hypothetical protein E4T66_08830 [Sinimarinibacterium sp. CAU 1509]